MAATAATRVKSDFLGLPLPRLTGAVVPSSITLATGPFATAFLRGLPIGRPMEVGITGLLRSLPLGRLTDAGAVVSCLLGLLGPRLAPRVTSAAVALTVGAALFTLGLTADEAARGRTLLGLLRLRLRIGLSYVALAPIRLGGFLR